MNPHLYERARRRAAEPLPHTPDYGAPGHPKNWCERCRLELEMSPDQADGTAPTRSIYIAGPMTGYDGQNVEAFRKAATWFRLLGWTVFSPVDITERIWREKFGTDFDWYNAPKSCEAGGDIYRDFLREDLRTILDCDAIALLPGWEHSNGVDKELTVARAMKLAVFNDRGERLA